MLLYPSTMYVCMISCSSSSTSFALYRAIICQLNTRYEYKIQDIIQDTRYKVQDTWYVVPRYEYEQYKIPGTQYEPVRTSYLVPGT